MKKKGYILLSVICAVVLIATGIILGVVMKKQSNKKTYTASIKTAEGACMETACACPETTADTGISGSIPYTAIPVILHHRT